MAHNSPSDQSKLCELKCEQEDVLKNPPWRQTSTRGTNSSSLRKVEEMHPGCPALRGRAAHVMTSSELQEKNFSLLHPLWLLVVRSINMDYVKEPTSLRISSISSRVSGGLICAQPFKRTRSVSALFLQRDPLAGQTASNSQQLPPWI